MRLIRAIGALALAAGAAAGCEDITNPIEEFGTLEDPFVRFAAPQTVGTPGSTNPVVIELPTRVEEDVTVEFSFGGNAVFGEDFVIVDQNGDPRDDVTAAGGTATIPFIFDQNTELAADTLLVFVPFDATDGTVLEIQIESAVTASGRVLETGFIGQFQSHDFSIEGFVTAGVATGTYTGTLSGDFSGDLDVTVTLSPIVIDGVEFSFVLSNIGQNVFSGAVPWAFNVTSGGTAVFASTDAAEIGVTGDVTGGTYDFDAQNLTFDFLLTNIAPGLTWSYDITAQ